MVVSLSVIVCNLNVECIVVFPSETDSPLQIDPDAALPFPVSSELLKAVAGRDAKVVDANGPMDQNQLAQCQWLYLSREFF